MFSLRVIVFGLCLICCQSTLHAKQIKIAGDQPRKHITVTIENATIGFILKNFSETYNFEVKGLENVGSGQSMTVTMSGNLETILRRLLRNWNYMLVRSQNNKSGIKKIMILNSAYGAIPSHTRHINAGNVSKVLQRRFSQRHATD